MEFKPSKEGSENSEKVDYMTLRDLENRSSRGSEVERYEGVE